MLMLTNTKIESPSVFLRNCYLNLLSCSNLKLVTGSSNSRLEDRQLAKPFQYTEYSIPVIPCFFKNIITIRAIIPTFPEYTNWQTI